MVNFFVTLTTKCDLQCRYCYGECCDDFDYHDDGLEVDYYLPSTISYDTDALKSFLSRDPESKIIFYGGEPLLELEKIKELMNTFSSHTILLHTNGTMLDRLEPEYVNRFPIISISIDGDEKLTDYYRGSGVYAKIRDNLKLIRSNGYKGEVIARMTVMEETDIYSQALHLLNDPVLSFDSVHWQLNALFWRNDYKRRDFARWANESYNPGVKKLIKEWIRVMKEEGRVLRIYPFMGMMQSLLTDEKTLLRCGAGWAEYNVQTDGKVSPCPVMSGLKDFYAGDIHTSDPLSLRKVLISGPCKNCEELEVCGGRCLYANVTMKWGEKGFSEVCSTIKFYINALREEVPVVRELIEQGKISMDDFRHVRYNSCEIIP